MPTHSWTHLKPHLQRLTQGELIQLLRDLYGLNADTKLFPTSHHQCGDGRTLSGNYPPGLQIAELKNPNRTGESHGKHPTRRSRD